MDHYLIPYELIVQTHIPLMETHSLLDALKKQLKSRGLRYSDLADRLSLSVPTVKRSLNDGNISVERLLAFCEIANIEFGALLIAANREKPRPTSLTLQQERALAKDTKLLSFLNLLLNDWEVDEIVKNFEVDTRACERMLLQLDRLGVIELGASLRFKLLVERSIRWRSGGPIAAALGVRALNEYLTDSTFTRRDEFLRYSVREVSVATHATMQRKLQTLAREFDELADLDGGLPPSDRVSVGMLVALRPWNFSMFEAIKRLARTAASN
ncbi:MAG: XRE family transcriptional regulator [Burkholderiales bacterium]|nr:MAG: XRE family transcriptional regulator [Betaproteobacteria bacterium]TAG84071.1 MAG: XRE family transcriptional regulator [Burkholderiales bacterium]